MITPSTNSRDNSSVTIFDANHDSWCLSDTRLSKITPDETKPNQVPALSNNLNKRFDRQIYRNDIRSNFFTFHSPGSQIQDWASYCWPKDSFLEYSKSNVKGAPTRNVIDQYTRNSPKERDSKELLNLLKKYSIE